MLEAPPLPSLLYIYMSMVCDKGKGRPLGELKATLSTALKVLQCSKTIISYDHSQCVLLVVCVCALGRRLAEKVLGLGQRRGGPPPPSQGGCPPPPYSPPNCRKHPSGSHIGWRRPPWWGLLPHWTSCPLPPPPPMRMQLWGVLVACLCDLEATLPWPSPPPMGSVSCSPKLSSGTRSTRKTHFPRAQLSHTPPCTHTHRRP